MINAMRVANAFATMMFIVRAVLAIMALLLPDFFAWLYKAVTMGQNAAFRNPTGQEVIITTIVPTVIIWLIAYGWATAYNFLGKK
jgi:hypothetical protein